MTMQAQADIRLRLARERRSAQIRAAADARAARLGAPTRPNARRPIRRAIGSRLIALGIRLVADPTPIPTSRPARTR